MILKLPLCSADSLNLTQRASVEEGPLNLLRPALTAIRLVGDGYSTLLSFPFGESDFKFSQE